MSVSRKDKSRKSNLINYKNKVKKMENINVPKFNQVPYWEPNAEFKITGEEFTSLQQFFQVFAEPLGIMQDIYRRELDSGGIRIKYTDDEGNEIPEEKVKSMIKEYREQMKNKASK